MSRPGSNLPGFRDAQIEFAAHIRNPELNPAPADVEPRRMQIYRDLFYNNIEGFLASSFPVAKKTLGEQVWHRLARRFVHRHPSQSPYFLEISQEFLTFLETQMAEDKALPPWLLELAHYEWVELALGVSEVELPTDVDPEGDLLMHPVVMSPLIWCLAYRYPVHQIGPDHQPDAPPEQATEIVVYRNRRDDVGFMVVNPVTLRLIALLEEGLSGSDAISAVVEELTTVETGGKPERFREQGVATLSRLRDAEIVLGSRKAPGG